MARPPGEWTPAEATDRIRQCARDARFTPHWKGHLLECLHERNLDVGDVLYALREGLVRDAAAPSDVTGFFRYAIEAKTPNSEGRTVRVVVTPSAGCELKVMKVTWRDEQ